MSMPRRFCAPGLRKNVFAFGTTANTISFSGWHSAATPARTAVCLGQFVTGVMRIVLLMRRDFTPYWKWLAFEFRKRPQAQPYFHSLHMRAVPRGME